MPQLGTGFPCMAYIPDAGQTALSFDSASAFGLRFQFFLAPPHINIVVVYHLLGRPLAVLVVITPLRCRDQFPFPTISSKSSSSVLWRTGGSTCFKSILMGFLGKGVVSLWNMVPTTCASVI